MEKEDIIKEFIRDVCSVVPKPKSEVRHRLNDILEAQKQKIWKEHWEKGHENLINKQDLLEKIEGMKKEYEHFEKETPYYSVNENMRRHESYNKALEDIKKLIK